MARYSLVSSPLSLPYPLPPLPARCEADCSSLSLSLQPPEPNPKHTHTRTHWTPVHTWGRFNKYISVAARATRQALKEEQRLAAERRAAVTLKVQHWENGKAGPSVSHLLWSLYCASPAELTPCAPAGVDRQARRRAALNPLLTSLDGSRGGRVEQWGGMKARRRWLRSDWGGVLLRKTLKNPYFQSV